MKIMVAPQKVGTSTQNGRSIRKVRPRVVGMTEMDNGLNDSLLIAMSAALGRLFQLFAQDLGKHSREVPLYVRISRFCKVVLYKTMPLSDNVGTSGMGNDRWVNIIILKWFGTKWVIMETHLNAGIQSMKSGDLLTSADAIQREKAYIKSVSLLEVITRSYMDQYNGRVILMGDFNMIPKGDGLSWNFSPAALFRRLDMRWVNDRVIYMAWGKGLNMYRHKVIPAHSPQNASDHAWIVGWFWRSRR